ncbi:MAG TPA: class I tRNA ligase family protein, partial [Candidatus Limnocylindria bacterium]|nr:class I tRNA ligase family protein [Candidatus Limnocylindria bacterium]
MAADTSDKPVSFKDTLNLPQTEFPIHANPKVDDPAMIKRWEEEKLFHASYVQNEGKEKFVLHDGPPYANGNLHLGHAYNKILKDTVTKSQRMQGKHVPVTPGWDCHGLPIEFRVTKEQPGLPPKELTQACRAYAQKWIEVQKEEFKQLGVLMNWDKPYTTMSPRYEADTLRAFGRFVADGYIERKNKTIAWCPSLSCQTALAAAEIEYADRKDPSVYVLFALQKNVVERLVPALKDHEVNLLVWTTTPWTLPLNRAVLLKPGTVYAVLKVRDQYVVVAQALATKIAAMLGVEPEVVATFNSQDIGSGKAHHPFVEDLLVPLLLDDSVALEDGTASVHCAPGCGPEDYEVGIKNNLEIFSPISPDGKYTKGIEPQELVGMPVADGQIWVIKELAKRGRMLHKASITHSYPHCWRCRQGLIFRATKQWFCDLSKSGLRQRTIQAISDSIAFVPAASTNRLQATIEGRLEWCLSRQRVWGTPIPAFMCNKCDYTYVTQGLIDNVAQFVEKEGIEYWT